MTIKVITQDPIGLDVKTNTFFFEDEKHNVYLDAVGTPVMCDDCNVQQKVDRQGYFYCPNHCFGTHEEVEA
jgi:hypothetical protein